MDDSRNAVNDPLLSRDESSPQIAFSKLEDQIGFKSKMQRSGFFNYIHILFTVGTLRKANSLSKKEKTLEDQDIPALGYNERTEQLEKRLMHNYRVQKEKSGKVSLSSVVLKTFRRQIAIAFFLDAVYKSLRVLLAWLLAKLLEILVVKSIDLKESFIWTGILGGVLVLASYFEQHWMFISTQTGIRLRAGLIKMVYSKLTRISVHSLNDLSIGKIVNVVANDVNIFERRGCFFSTVFLGIPTLFGGVFVLWTFFDWAAVVGIAYMIFTIPIQLALIGASTKPQAEKNMITDERVKLTNELIDGIKLLKMYAWESVFGTFIKKLRTKEIALLKRGATFEGIARGVALSVTAVGAYLTFVVYTQVLGGELKLYHVFPTLFIMGFIRIHVIFYTLNGFSVIAETKMIFQRIQQILDAPEITEKNFGLPLDETNAVEFSGFTGYWSKIPEPTNIESDEPPQAIPAISNINLEIKKGSMHAIVGTVGSGKSSLLLAFTGEMPSIQGRLSFQGTTAYAEQEPTIFPGLLRDNILFGKSYRAGFYNEVVKACCLENDFKQFPFGDLTEIGEKGVNLSGGQKARIALARAIYSEADIYLLDDPLSAVDAKVAKKLYEQAICGMLKGKTVLLVTHQVHFVKELNNIIVMIDGRIAGTGSYAQLRDQNVDAEAIFSMDKNKSRGASLRASVGGSFGFDSVAFGNVGQSLIGDGPVIPLEEVEIQEEEMMNTKNNEEAEDEKGKLVKPEDPTAAKVTSATYGAYVKAMGNKCFTLIVIFIFFGAVVSDLVFARFVGLWAQEVITEKQALIIIGALCGVIFISYLTKSVVYANVVLNASKNLHNNMLDKIIRSPPDFFDTNPVGRILNRFSNDVGVLDKFLPLPQEDVVTISIAFFAMTIAIAYINPTTLGPIFFGAIIIWLITRFCTEGVKQTKVFELTSRSPVYSLFSTTLAGLISIRSYNQIGQFQKSFAKLMDTNLKAGSSFTSNNQFLGITIDLTYTLISVGTIISLFYFRKEDDSLLGFSICYILLLNGMLQYNFRMMVQTKILMSSAARIQSYCNNQPELPVKVSKDYELESAQWPRQGAIEFKDVHMRYRESADYVLKGLSFVAKPGEKIGCVGRTGAGKSSVIQALFRMVEIERHNKEASYIKIDGVDTQEVGLHFLRNNISIIPQTPVVFSGTIKRNLDPLDEHSDQELWSILEEVKLRQYVENIEGQLYADMTNAASVFSVGQKQLICLARAILKKSKIVVLDEATANVDTQTDNFIQQKIMEKFKECTVFTIAHRLSTIANYDKVLVLDKGQIVEYDMPYKLLVSNVGDTSITNKDGYFASMVMNTGPRASYNIFKKAKGKYENAQKGLENI